MEISKKTKANILIGASITILLLCLMALKVPLLETEAG